MKELRDLEYSERMVSCGVAEEAIRIRVRLDGCGMPSTLTPLPHQLFVLHLGALLVLKPLSPFTHKPTYTMLPI